MVFIFFKVQENKLISCILALSLFFLYIKIII
jgi:hypothetical protein